jgi:hypothetical protein
MSNQTQPPKPADAQQPTDEGLDDAICSPSDYDAGLLNDYGGGDVEWWQDYLRAEIGRANDYWREIHDQQNALMVKLYNQGYHAGHEDTVEACFTPIHHTDMEGVWQSPGAYTIEWQDEDHVRVTKHWRGFDDVAVLTGGDFETILETLFTGAVVTRVHSPANTES